MTVTPQQLADARLTERQITALSLIYWDRMTVRQAARLMHVDEKRVRVMRDAGLKRLSAVGIDLPAVTETRSHLKAQPVSMDPKLLERIVADDRD